MITVCIRMWSAFRTYAAISLLNGRDASYSCRLFQQSRDFLLLNHGWTLELLYIERYKALCSQWRSALIHEYEKSGLQWSALPDGIQKACTFMDGTRIQVSRCKDYGEKNVLYSRYKRNHNLNYLALYSPCGLCIGLVPPSPGHANDCTSVTEYDINSVLAHLLESSTLCDSLFPYNSHIMALRDGLVTMGILDEDQLKQLRSLRTSIEHGFGYVKRTFPFILYGRQQVNATSPNRSIRLAFLLSNIKVCMRGNTISLRYMVKPPCLRDYLQIESNHSISQ